MPTEDFQTELAEQLADLREQDVLSLVQRRVGGGDDPLQIIEECQAGLRLVGERYENHQYFLTGLIMAGEIFRRVTEIVEPALESRVLGQASGRVLMGTVQGDIHDIGKNLVSMLLTCYGFMVTDLGVNVPPVEFVARVSEVPPDVVGLCGLLTTSYETMRETIALLRAEAQLKHLSLPIIIGGGMINDEVCRYVGADHWAPDAMAGVRLCQQLTSRG